MNIDGGQTSNSFDGEFKGDVDFDGDLIVTGNGTFENLLVNDTITTNTLVTVETVETKDNLLHLSLDNVSDTVTSGYYHELDDGTVKYSGIMRDGTTHKHYVIEKTTTKPLPATDITILPRGDILLNDLEAVSIKTQSVDNTSSLNIGTVNATSIELSRVGINTTVKGDLLLDDNDINGIHDLNVDGTITLNGETNSILNLDRNDTASTTSIINFKDNGNQRWKIGSEQNETDWKIKNNTNNVIASFNENKTLTFNDDVNINKSLKIGDLTTINGNAVLDLSATSDKCLLLPYMNSATRDNLIGEVEGLCIYNTSTSQLQIYNGTSWDELPNLDQELLTTSDVTFNDITVNGEINFPSNLLINHNSNNVISADVNKTELYLNGGLARLKILTTQTDIFSPDTLNIFRVRNNDFIFNIGVNTRLYIDANKTNIEKDVTINGSVNIGSAVLPDASAILDLKSSTKGLLVPRLTTIEKNNIVSPATGLICYDTDVDELQYYNSTSWVSSSGSFTDPLTLKGLTVEDVSDGKILLIRDTSSDYATIEYKTGATLNFSTGLNFNQTSYVIKDLVSNYALLTAFDTTLQTQAQKFQVLGKPAGGLDVELTMFRTLGTDDTKIVFNDFGTEFFSIGLKASNDNLLISNEDNPKKNIEIVKSTNAVIINEIYTLPNSAPSTNNILKSVSGGTLGFSDTVNLNTATFNTLNVGSPSYVFPTAQPANGNLFLKMNGSGTSVVFTQRTQAGSSDPTVNDDDTIGYSINSVITNQTSDKSFICVQSTTANAIWKEITKENLIELDDLNLTSLQDEDILQYNLSTNKWLNTPIIYNNISLQQTGGQTLASSTGVFTPIEFGSELFKSNITHSNVTNNSRITITRAGKYRVSYDVPWTVSNVGYRLTFVGVNGLFGAGDSRYARVQISPNSTAGHSHSGCSLINLAVNDYIELYAQQNSGGTLDIGNINLSYRAEFDANWVGP